MKEKRKQFYKEDKIATIRERFKEHPNPKLQKLNKKDIRELVDELADCYEEILLSAPEYGFDTLHIGLGQIILSVRKPHEITDIKSGEKVVTQPTALFYFKPSDKFKHKMRAVLAERYAEEEENE